jgi:Flp pilus assembly protein TadG
MQHTIHHTRRGTASGQAIVVMAVAMVGLLAFVALALDGGRYFSQRRTAQNAADMSALAAIYKYARESDTATERDVLREINRVAEINGIADTDATLANGVNANVNAWWVNAAGDELDVINDDPAQFAPVGAGAIKVRAQIPYQTFLTGLIGQPTTRAEAQSIARITITYKRFNDNTAAMFTAGGGDCNNLTDRIAHHYFDTNSAKFLSDVYVDGSLAVASVNASDFYGNFQVRLMTGVLSGGSYVQTLGDPFSGGGNTFHNGSTYIPPNPADPSRFSDWAMLEVDGTLKKLDASDFRPIEPIGEMYRRYQVFRRFGLAPVDFYHYVAADPVAIDALYNSGARGIYYVDGSLTIPAGTQEWEGVTLIVTGTFNNLDGNHDFWAAGWTSGGRDDKVSGLAMNISVLAGADLGGTARCASYPTNWVFNAENNNSQYHGTIYVPWGQIYFHGNTSGGTATGQFSEGVLTYSVYLDGNSWQFQFNPQVWVQPIPATELNN